MKKNNKGFTLIEIIVVVIIIGILLLITVPAVSKYIDNSRLKTYKTNLTIMIESVKTEVIAGYDENYQFLGDEYLVVPFECINLEKGNNKKSPYGSYIPAYSFVTAERTENGYKFMVTAIDDINYGTELSEKEDIKIKGQNIKNMSYIYGNEDNYSVELKGYVTTKTPSVYACNSFKENSSIEDIPSNPEGDYKTLSEQILEDNNEQSDVNLSFPKTSTTAVTAGLYYTNVNTEGNRTTYYFRGPVTNNYVKFGKEGDSDIYWRIIRINEDGSIRLIYQGTSVDTATAIDNMEWGGTDIEALRYENSSVKTSIDNWYANNLKTNYGKYLADSGFCSDMSILTNGDGNHSVLYASYSRLNGSQRPQFKCSQASDLYTLRGSNKGNKLLDNPIGLITADESRYAGIGYYYSRGEYNTYLNNVGSKQSYLTMSPMGVGNNPYLPWVFTTGPYLNEVTTYDSGEASYDIRPVINLNFDTQISGGNGTDINPYVVITN